MAAVTAHIYRTFLCALAMFLCALAGGGIAAFVSLGSKLSGKEFWFPGVVAAVLIFAVALLFRSRLQWPLIDLLASLVCVEIISLCIIALFSGLTWRDLFSQFNLWWLGSISIFIAPPWLAGILIGSYRRTTGQFKA